MECIESSVEHPSLTLIRCNAKIKYISKIILVLSLNNLGLGLFHIDSAHSTNSFPMLVCSQRDMMVKGQWIKLVFRVELDLLDFIRVYSISVIGPATILSRQLGQ